MVYSWDVGHSSSFSLFIARLSFDNYEQRPRGDLSSLLLHLLEKNLALKTLIRNISFELHLTVTRAKF